MSVADPARTLRVDRLAVHVYRSRVEMGAAAASRAADCLRAAIAGRGQAGVVFASAPSQVEFLQALGDAPDLDWSRVHAFHLDEYLGLPAGARQGFGEFLRGHLFDRVRPGRVEFLDGNATDVSAEARRYGALLQTSQLDLACVGVGENGHLAFNEPDDTDFEDPALVRVVTIAEASRRQQMHDGCFGALAEVPTRAITLTVPAIIAARAVVCVVPAVAKREALRRVVRGPVSTECPASVLRRHPDAVVFADGEAAFAL